MFSAIHRITGTNTYIIAQLDYTTITWKHIDSFTYSLLNFVGSDGRKIRPFVSYYKMSSFLTILIQCFLTDDFVLYLTFHRHSLSKRRRMELEVGGRGGCIFIIFVTEKNQRLIFSTQPMNKQC